MWMKKLELIQHGEIVNSPQNVIDHEVTREKFQGGTRFGGALLRCVGPLLAESSPSWHCRRAAGIAKSRRSEL
jgi:hypothetical protein